MERVDFGINKNSQRSMWVGEGEIHCVYWLYSNQTTQYHQMTYRLAN